MYDLFNFIDGYVKHHENQTYGDLQSKLKEDKIRSMLSDKEYEIYNKMKTEDKQRLLKYQ